jgi:hypothetical protein
MTKPLKGTKMIVTIRRARRPRMLVMRAGLERNNGFEDRSDKSATKEGALMGEGEEEGVTEKDRLGLKSSGYDLPVESVTKAPEKPTPRRICR